jgi:hypothetical protein
LDHRIGQENLTWPQGSLDLALAPPELARTASVVGAAG